MRRRFLSILLLFCSCAGFVRAQYDIRLSQYFMVRSFYNPAAAGTTDNLNLTALTRLEMVGVHGAPKSFFITADMPLVVGNTRHGVGLALFTESIGLFRNTHAALQYAYQHKLGRGLLSGGLQVGIVNQAFDGTKVITPESEFHQGIDPAIPNKEVSGMGLDMNMGLYYTHKTFYAGIGMMHLTQPELQLDENAYTYIGYSLNFMGGYNIQLRNPLIELQPSVFLLTDMRSFHMDLTARLEYNKMFNGGFSYRVNESVGIMFGVRLGRFQGGYSFDFPTTALGRASSGSHELYLKYALRLQATKTGRNRHKSVRIL